MDSRRRSDDALRCPEGQYFDSVVERCGSCADICAKSDPIAFCVHHCPDYYRSNTRRAIVDATSPSRPSSYSVASMHHVERLIDKPLFWTSVTSMSIATVATIGIIVLCVIRWKSAGRRGRSHRYFSPTLRDDGSIRKGDGKSSGLDKKKSMDIDHSELNSKLSDPSYNKYSMDECQGPFVSLRPTPSCADGRIVANRLQDCIAQMTSLVSEEEGCGPVSRHLGTNVDVTVRNPRLSIETCPNGVQQLPKHIQSIDLPSHSQAVDSSTECVNSEGCWTSSTMPHYSSFCETSAKRLSVDDGVVSLASLDDWPMGELFMKTVLPLVHVPGNRQRPSALDFKDEEVVLSLRSETGYRSDHVTVA